MNSEFTFTLTRDEYLYLQWALTSKAILAMAVVVGAGATAIGVISGDVAVIGAALVSGPLVYLILRQSMRASYGRAWAASDGLRSEWKVKLDDEGIHHDNADGRSMVRWRAVDRVRVTPTFWLFHLRTNSWLFLPRRAIGNVRQEREMKSRFERNGLEVKDADSGGF